MPNFVAKQIDALYRIFDEGEGGQDDHDALLTEVSKITNRTIFIPNPVMGASDIFAESPEYAIVMYQFQKAWAEAAKAMSDLWRHVEEFIADGGDLEELSIWLNAQVGPISIKLREFADATEAYGPAAREMMAP